jgi:hypothetical protein
MRRLCVSIALALALAGCLKPAPPPAAAPPEILAGTATVGLSSLPPAAVAAWLGAWRSGASTLTIARAGDTLTANGMPLTLVGLGTFSDAAGTAYLFGPGETLVTYPLAGNAVRWAR